MPQGLRVRVSSCPPKIMKVTVNSKKGLKIDLKVFVDKKTMNVHMSEKYEELKKTVALKGFRPFLELTVTFIIFGGQEETRTLKPCGTSS